MSDRRNFLGSVFGMSTAAVLDGVADRLLLGRETNADRLWADPALPMRLYGLQPDPWQEELLADQGRQIGICCSRQTGKSWTCAAKTVATACSFPNSLVLILSPSARQSIEQFRRVRDLYFSGLHSIVPLSREANQSSLELANGSRIVSLPENERTIRTFSSVRLLIIDEAARVPDELYYAVRPMLAVSRGQIIALSSPFGRRGWFYSEFVKGGASWERYRVPATECPRMTAEFLATERRTLGDRWFNQEYMCSFEDTVGAVFSQDVIDAAMDSSLESLELF